MNKKEMRQVLDAPRSFERDKALREHQNKFIEKSNVNRRLFDTVFVRCSSKRHIGVEKRGQGGQ